MFFKSFYAFLMAIAVSIGASILLVIFVQCCPKGTLKVVLYLSLVAEIALAVLLFLY
jgi:hypothetical protein